MPAWLNLGLLFMTLIAAVVAGRLYRRVKELMHLDPVTGALSRHGFIEEPAHER